MSGVRDRIRGKNDVFNVFNVAVLVEADTLVASIGIKVSLNIEIVKDFLDSRTGI